MKNKDIITLANDGFLNATAHSLPDEHFYKWHKFKRAIGKAVHRLADEQKALMLEAGIDPEKFSEAKGEARDRYSEANGKLLDEDCSIEVKARIPFDFYKNIYDENKTAAGDIFADPDIESLIIDNLFIVEEDESL